MAADPRSPSSVHALHDGVLDSGVIVAGEDGAGLGRGESLRVVGFEDVDPPVRAVSRGGAHVESPAAGLSADHRRTLHALGVELGLVEHGHGGEVLAVGRARDDRLIVSVMTVADAVADDERAVLIEGRVWGSRPVARSGTRRRYRHDGIPGARQRKIGHPGTLVDRGPIRPLYH
jgi:hypothetical protein